MSFDRTMMPDPMDYYATIGLVFEGRGKWVTTGCEFHGSSDSLRVHKETGAFVCMAACGAKGGNPLDYHMAFTGATFVEAAKALGCWRDDGNKTTRHRPTTIPARAMLELVANEVRIAAVVSSDLARGRTVSVGDHERLMAAAGRIAQIDFEVNHHA